MRKLLKAIAIGILPLSVLVPTANADTDTSAEPVETCVIAEETLSGGDCYMLQSQADAAWEGLSSEDQKTVMLSGLSGWQLDEYVINYRDAMLPCEEDEPCWNCETMGNNICGPGPATTPTPMTELPRTN